MSKVSKFIDLVDDLNYYRGIVKGLCVAYELTEKMLSRVNLFPTANDLLIELRFQLCDMKAAYLKQVGEEVCAQR